MQYFTKARVAPVLGEFLGTGILVMVALVLTGQTRVSYFIATSLATTLAVVYMMFSGVSGAHVNPAVTFGLWAARRIRTAPAISYIVAQLAAGFGALKLYEYFVGQSLPEKVVGADFKIWLAEAVGAMIVVMGFTAAISKGYDALQSALTYGASLFVGITVATIVSAGYLNPAVAVGVNSVSWAYIVAPLAGGLAGAALYTYLFTATSFPRFWVAGNRTKAASKRR